jgi:RNA polymerase sigma-70 factor, ECF subfamily
MDEARSDSSCRSVERDAAGEVCALTRECAREIPEAGLPSSARKFHPGARCMRHGPDHGQRLQRLDFGEYLDGLYGYAMVLSRNRAEAEDLVQETCLRALRAIDRLHTQSNVKGWLFTILRNIWLNQIRRRRSSDLIELGEYENGARDPADARQDPHAVYVGRAEQEQVRAAIQRLPAEFREIIILREYEELSYQEIAALLDCPQGTVMSRLARARSKLRNLLSSTLMASPSEQDEVERPAA